MISIVIQLSDDTLWEETLVSIWISLCPELTALLTVGMSCSWTVSVPCPGRHLVIMYLLFTWVSIHCVSEVWIVLGDGKDRIVFPCLLDLTHNGLYCTRLSSSAGCTERDLLRHCFGYSRSLCRWGDWLGFLQRVLIAQMLTHNRENLLLD